LVSVIRFEAAHFGGLNFSLDLTFLGYCERITELRGTNKSPVYHRLALSDRCKTLWLQTRETPVLCKRDIVLFRSARKKNLRELFAIRPNVDCYYSRWSTKKCSARQHQSRNHCASDADRIGSSRLRATATQPTDLKISPTTRTPNLRHWRTLRPSADGALGVNAAQSPSRQSSYDYTGR